MTRKKIGLILMIVGLAITLFLISSILIQDMYVWGNNLNAFARKYDSFYDMIATRENGAFIISIAAGSLLFFPGLFLRLWLSALISTTPDVVIGSLYWTVYRVY